MFHFTIIIAILSVCLLLLSFNSFYHKGPFDKVEKQPLMVANAVQKVTYCEVAVAIADFSAAVKSFYVNSKNHTWQEIS